LAAVTVVDAGIAWRRTDARTCNVDARLGRLTGIAVGLAIAPADRIKNDRAGDRLKRTDAGPVVTHTRIFFTIITGSTLVIVRAEINAGPVMVFGHRGLATQAVVPVGLAVTSANRIVNQWADVRNRNTYALGIGDIAASRGKFAEIIRIGAGNPDDAATNLLLLTYAVVFFGNTGHPAQAIIVIGHAVALAFLTELVGPAFIVALAEIVAGPVVILGHAGLLTYAVVAVGFAVAATDRIKYQWTNIRYRDTGSANIGNLTTSVRNLAELIVSETREHEKAAAELGALAVGGNVHPCGPGFTRIAVGGTVASTNRIPDVRVHIRFNFAYPGAVSTLTIILGTVFTGRTFVIVLAVTDTHAVMVLGNAGLASFAIIGIGQTVAPADRGPIRRVHIRDRNTDPLVICDLTGSIRKLAILICSRTGDSGEATADRGSSARPMVIFGYACLYAFAIIVMGLAIAPADRIKNGRATSRSRHADTLVIRHVTGAGRKIAQLVRLAGNPGKTAANWL